METIPKTKQTAIEEGITDIKADKLTKIDKPKNLLVMPETEKQLNAVRAFLEEMKIKFEETDNHYDDEFVNKIREAEQEIKTGKVRLVTKKNQRTFLGL